MPPRTSPALRAFLTAAILAIAAACSRPPANLNPPATQPTAQPTAASPAPLPLQDALHQAIRYLYAQQQRNGTWETADSAQTDPQFGQRTAMAVYALLSAGEDPAYPKLAPAIQFLKLANIRGVYALGWRCMVWNAIPNAAGDPEIRAAMQRDLNFLQRALHVNSMMFGDTIDSPQADYDHAASSCAVMGMWALQESGMEVPLRYWTQTRLAWMADQNRDGGWDNGRLHYQPEGSIPSTPAMTAAAMTTLLMVEDEILQGTTAYYDNPAVDRGLDWLGDHFDDLFSGRVYPSLFQIERAGDATGCAHFKNVDWFAAGSDFILRHQDPAGSWAGNVIDTSYAMLFLARGGAPVTMNKLKYDNDVNGKAVQGEWNQRPRDVANFTRWMKDQLPHYPALNWRIVTLDSPPAELHAAPILYVSGNHPLQFSDEDRRKLKQYIDDGGTVLFSADYGSKEFTNSVIHLGTTLYPNAEFRRLSDDDPLFADAKFHFRYQPPALLGLSDGKRNAMLLVLEQDLSRDWQARRFLSQRNSFALGGDIILSASANTGLLSKTDVYPAPGLSDNVSPPQDQQHQPDQQTDQDVTPGHSSYQHLAMPPQGAAITISKLQYFNELDGKPVEADWNHWPHDVENFNRWLVDDYGLAPNPGWNVVTLDASPRQLHQAPVLLISGSQPLHLTQPDQQKLKLYIDQGGFVFFNADEGSLPFTHSVLDLAKKLYPDYKFQFLTSDDPDAQPNFWTGHNLPRIQCLGNRVRAFMLLASAVDVCRDWQQQAPYGGSYKSFNLGASLLMYTSDQSILRAKDDSYLVDPDPTVHADETLKIARIQYPGPWDPEPQAWNRMAAIIHNSAQINLKIDTVNIADAQHPKLAGYDIAVLTGTDKPDITEAGWAELQNFAQSGGTLIIDNAGGVRNSPFDWEIFNRFRQTYPSGEQIDSPIPLSDVFYSPMGLSAADIAFRPYARTLITSPIGPQIRAIRFGPRIAVFYSPDDITEGLLGEPITGVTGYDPKSAARLTENMLLYAAIHLQNKTP